MKIKRISQAPVNLLGRPGTQPVHMLGRIEVATINIDGSTNVYVNTSAYWAARPDYRPDFGVVIGYTDRETVTVDGVTKNVPGFKIGDGDAYLADLPFEDAAVVATLTAHMQDVGMHVTAEEKAFWNNKLNLTISGEVLTFNRL